MRISCVIVSVVGVVTFAFSSLAGAQAPQAARAEPSAPTGAARPASAEPAGERPRATRPPLFLKEDWKQIRAAASIP
jgi:hypothetical protein